MLSIYALDSAGREISVSEFFSQYEAFSDNSLPYQSAVRTLKTYSGRTAEEVELVSEPHLRGRCFHVIHRKHTYEVAFALDESSVTLVEIN